MATARRAFLSPLALAGILAVALLLLAQAPATSAATITVTTTDDELNADGDCSLREAIQAANTDSAVDACSPGSGADTIVVPAGTYTLSIAGAGEDANATGDLDISADLTINGAGAATTIVQACDSSGGPCTSFDRVFHVVFVAVGIAGVTIQNGNPVGGGFPPTGGGGGIFNQGTLMLNNSTVSGNTAGDRGGGIYNHNFGLGPLIITNSTVSNNVSGNSCGGGIGIDSPGDVTLTNSTVSGNTSATCGGGIYTTSSSVTLTDSTISGNTSANPGGGVFVDGFGELTLNNSTVSGNTSGLFGGGIQNFGTATLKNTIVANNSGGDCGAGGITSAGHNLDSDGTCGLGAPGDIPNGNANLDSLALNAPGTTATHALLPGSDAIDAVPLANCTDLSGNPVTIDQRGVARPQGAACDIGAFELEAPTYDFAGFFSPVDNPPVFNSAKAGSAVPVKFSLGGDQGLGIFATGYPRSQGIGCDTSARSDTIEETVTAGSSSLSYDPIADQYVYVWKSAKAWAGTCRQLIVRLNDLTEHVANFRFK